MPNRTPTVLRPAQLAETARAVAANPARWLSLVRYDAGRRWYLRLAQDDELEVWLLSWLPGQRTGFHDHGAASGAFAVAIGSLTERGAPRGRPEDPGRTLRQGAVRSFGRGYVHDVSNTAAAAAVSVHAYSPPLTAMRRYEVGDAGLLRLTTAGKSW
jgi:predicted metal-dependent enzyme (double-stranded beta helix superfamily)